MESASRRFTRKQRQAVELITGRTGEADHIQPYARGGQTSVENCQMISAETNRAKGAFHFEPRKWQAEFLGRWGARRPGAPFTLIAIPGSGKTMAALEAARRWMAAGADRRVVVVVPTRNLQEQWQQQALRFGIELQTKEFGTNFRDGIHGFSVTYQTVGNNYVMFRKLCSIAPTMVIFDEIHHCGEESHYGTGVLEGFNLAKEHLCMSGTPWKTDGSAIPFVRYDGGGFAVADYRYDYPDALTDEVVRYLVFFYAKGVMTNDFTGEQLELAQDVSDDDASRRLGLLLDADGEFVRQQIRDAHDRLLECRKSVKDAAAMAVCKDQPHAVRVARAIKEITGCDPSMLVSDKAHENDTVSGFRRSSKEWLVSVRKVSEGTDITRLQVLCYLTNVTSELFFRQIIGRVSRVRDLADYEGYVFLPADPRLIRCAQNIENAQVVALAEQVERELREIDRSPSQESFDSWTTEHSGVEVMMIGNARVSVAEGEEIARIHELTGVPMQKVMEVRHLLLASNIHRAPAEHQPAPISLEQRIDEARRKCSKAAARLARAMDVEVRDIHMGFKKPQSKMSLEELEAKHRDLLSGLREALRK